MLQAAPNVPAIAASARPPAALERILDLARWAPSGDNTQPWRFEVVGERHVIVHGHDTRDHCVYDLDGWGTQTALGALLETAAIAATEFGWRMQAQRRTGMPDTDPTFDLRFEPDAGVAPSALVDAIPRRSVQRRPMRTQPLDTAQKAALRAAVGADHDLLWIEGLGRRARMAGLLFRSARLRLITPEAYRVHRDIIEWNARTSVDRVPDQALGASPLTLHLMRFAMKSWERVSFFNRYLAGTWAPRIELDLIPALACAAHFVLFAKREPVTIDDNVAGGRAMQRLWLTATQQGLVLQPEVTPLIFARYARTGRTFSAVPGTSEAAARVGARLDGVVGRPCAPAVFMGRVGSGPQPRSRSLRRELDALLQPPAAP